MNTATHKKNPSKYYYSALGVIICAIIIIGFFSILNNVRNKIKVIDSTTVEVHHLKNNIARLITLYNDIAVNKLIANSSQIIKYDNSPFNPFILNNIEKININKNKIHLKTYFETYISNYTIHKLNKNTYLKKNYTFTVQSINCIFTDSKLYITTNISVYPKKTTTTHSFYLLQNQTVETRIGLLQKIALNLLSDLKNEHLIYSNKSRDTLNKNTLFSISLLKFQQMKQNKIIDDHINLTLFTNQETLKSMNNGKFNNDNTVFFQLTDSLPLSSIISHENDKNDLKKSLAVKYAVDFS